MKQDVSVLFFGSYPMSLLILKRLLNAPGVRIEMVISQSEKQKSRTFRNFLIEWANEYHPEMRLERVSSQQDITNAVSKAGLKQVDFVVCCWFLYKVPDSVISMARKEAVNIHPSLLPKYRGADPIRRAIMANESRTGVTLHRLTDKYDAGEILGQKEVAITTNAYFDDVCERLGHVGGDLLIETFTKSLCGQLAPRKQEEDEATYASSLTPEEMVVSETMAAIDVFNLVRATYPWKVAVYRHDEVRIPVGPVCEFDPANRFDKETVISERSIVFRDNSGSVKVARRQ